MYCQGSQFVDFIILYRISEEEHNLTHTYCRVIQRAPLTMIWLLHLYGDRDPKRNRRLF